MEEIGVKRTKVISKLAIASMITSFLAFLPIVSGIGAMVLGAIALHVLGLYKDKLKGKMFAIIGIAVGAAQVILISLIFLIIGYRYFASVEFDIFNANICAKLNKNEEAVYFYKKALLKIPKVEDYSFSMYEPIIYSNLAATYSLEGKQDLAFDAYHSELQVSKKLAGQAYYGIAISQHESGQLEQALDSLDKAIQSNPKFVLAYQEKASILRQLGRFEDSVKASKETIRLFPKFAQAYSTLGLGYEKLGRYEDAAKFHIEAICLNPKRYFPRDRLYFCLYQIHNPSLSGQLLERLKLADSNLAEEIAKRLAKGDVPQKDISKDFEESLNINNRKIYEGDIVDYSRIVRIPINDMMEFDFKTKEEILQLRKQAVFQHPELVDSAYQPSEEVFGQIQDNKPWWGVLGFSYYGDGPKSIEGVSWHSNFILNPYLLVALTDCYAHRVNNDALSPQEIYVKFSDLIWALDFNYARVKFNITDFWQSQSAMYGSKLSGDIFCLMAYNARDLGFKYLYVDEDKSRNILSLNKSGKPLAIPFLFHCGASCGYPGGCNNESPTSPNFRIKIQKIPAKVYIKLWRNEPKDFIEKPDMLFLIDIK